MGYRRAPTNEGHFEYDTVYKVRLQTAASMFHNARHCFYQNQNSLKQQRFICHAEKHVDKILIII